MRFCGIPLRANPLKLSCTVILKIILLKLLSNLIGADELMKGWANLLVFLWLKTSCWEDTTFWHPLYMSINYIQYESIAQLHPPHALHRNGKVVTLANFTSLDALEVVIMTTSTAFSDEEIVNVAIFPFQYLCWFLWYIPRVDIHFSSRLYEAIVSIHLSFVQFFHTDIPLKSYQVLFTLGGR